MTIAEKAFSFEGRIGRQDFIIGTIVCVAAGLIIAMIDLEAASDAAVALILLILGVITWMKAAVMAKRLHDIGRPGYFAAGIILLEFVTMLLIVAEASEPAAGIGLCWFLALLWLACETSDVLANRYNVQPIQPQPIQVAPAQPLQTPPVVTVHVIVQPSV